MALRPVTAGSAPHVSNYAQALEVAGASRLLFVSGQVPETRQGDAPAGFAARARLVWSNVIAQVESAGMTADNLVKVSTFLSDRRFAGENRSVRKEFLADRMIALTVIVTGIFDERWLLEIEAVAAA